MMEEWLLIDHDSIFLKRFLFSDSYLDHDKIVNYFIHEEKNKNTGPSLTYFLYDTTINGFAGALVYLENKDNKIDSNFYYEVAPFINEKDYEEKMLNLSLVILKGKKINEVRFEINKKDLDFINIVDGQYKVSSKDDCGETYRFCIEIL